MNINKKKKKEKWYVNITHDQKRRTKKYEHAQVKKGYIKKRRDKMEQNTRIN